eukprot:jgi/Mesvir1/1558/Mv14537-RA.1
MPGVIKVEKLHRPLIGRTTVITLQSRVAAIGKLILVGLVLQAVESLATDARRDVRGRMMLYPGRNIADFSMPSIVRLPIATGGLFASRNNLNLLKPQRATPHRGHPSWSVSCMASSVPEGTSHAVPPGGATLDPPPSTGTHMTTPAVTGATASTSSSNQSTSASTPPLLRTLAAALDQGGSSPPDTHGLPNFDIVVVGGGRSGLATAVRARQAGLSVALISPDEDAGHFSESWSVVTRGLLRTSRAMAAVKDAGRFGVNVPLEGVSVDFAKVMERLTTLEKRMHQTFDAKEVAHLGIQLYRGFGRFTGRNTVAVNNDQMTFKCACIATGASPIQPRLLGMDAAKMGTDPSSCCTYYTSDTLWQLKSIPKRLAVLGTGPLGCEMAQCFARLGSKVLLVGRSARILKKVEKDAAALMEGVLEREGVTLMMGRTLTEVQQGPGGTKSLLLKGAGGDMKVEVDEVAVFFGRKPNTSKLGLDAAGVMSDLNGIKVNDMMQTTNPAVFAVGDVMSTGLKYTRSIDRQADVVIQNGCFNNRLKFKEIVYPSAFVYTSPEIASVGLTQKEAEAQGMQVDVFSVSMADVERALLDGDDERGYLKVVTLKGTDEIVGATMVGEDACDVILEVTAIMVSGGGLDEVARMRHPSPTRAEAFQKVAKKCIAALDTGSGAGRTTARTLRNTLVAGQGQVVEQVAGAVRGITKGLGSLLPGKENSGTGSL